jgi:6-phosphogluconolactonase (cycloisomerase 2 family)
VDPLGSQGSLVLSRDGRWLLAVNAGSDEISAFRVTPDGVMLTDTVSSGGVFPSSLALDGNLLYVLNAGTNGGSPNIAGFRLSHGGELMPIAGATRALGAGAYSQVGFDPLGRVLVITQRDTNRIHVFPVDKDGVPGSTATTSPSVGNAPFGFDFDRRGHLLVSEAGTGSVTSYEIEADGTLRVISPMVVNGQAATCWLVGDGSRFAYTANTASSTLSAYGVHNGSGRLSLIEAVAGTGDLPIDLATSVDGRFLYAVNAGPGTVGAFRMNPDGSLTDLGTTGGLPAIHAQGIAAR